MMAVSKTTSHSEVHMKNQILIVDVVETVLPHELSDETTVVTVGYTEDDESRIMNLAFQDAELGEVITGSLETAYRAVQARVAAQRDLQSRLDVYQQTCDRIKVMTFFSRLNFVITGRIGGRT